MKIGIVDLDTSHPASWIPLERAAGHEVVALYDGGSVHPPDYVETFAREHGIARVHSSLEAMAGEVDAAIIHGCDWSTHVEKARPFVEAGKAVFLDKPVAGNLEELRQVERWARAGARITGGSALRFCREIMAWQGLDAAERGEAHTLFAGCAVDEFNYGIHAYSLACAVLGEGIVSVRHLGQRVQRRLQLNWADGRSAFLSIGKQEGWMPYHATIITDLKVFQLQPEVGLLYAALLERVLPYLAGETDTPPLSPEGLIEPELAALAAKVSWEEGDREVLLSELREGGGYDGPVFAHGYRAAKYG
ncbi:MAG TPA: Gfo/Idh/MocA family oxidoreductase [Chthoniobacteraceae bacterium]|nr:Gfo/Idh/MocA family oxidoreductase [Chthoniobacteraceae bacterium]